MNDLENIQVPVAIPAILDRTAEIGFQMGSEMAIGLLLKTLAASKPGGRFLELGTGSGLATAWLLAGMDSASTLISVENEEPLMAIARECLGQDRRVQFQLEDAGIFLTGLADRGQQFDLIFADTWAGKYTHLERAIQLLKTGGFYVIDDMLPQPTWPEGHELKAAKLIAELETRSDLAIAKLSWSSGIAIAVKL